MDMAYCRLNLTERLSLAVSWSARQLSPLLLSDFSSFLFPTIWTKESLFVSIKEIKLNTVTKVKIQYDKGEGGRVEEKIREK